MNFSNLLFRPKWTMVIYYTCASVASKRRACNVSVLISRGRREFSIEEVISSTKRIIENRGHSFVFKSRRSIPSPPPPSTPPFISFSIDLISGEREEGMRFSLVPRKKKKYVSEPHLRRNLFLERKEDVESERKISIIIREID